MGAYRRFIEEGDKAISLRHLRVFVLVYLDSGSAVLSRLHNPILSKSLQQRKLRIRPSFGNHNAFLCFL